MAQEFVNPTTPTLPQLDGLEEVAFSNEDIQSIKLGLLDDVDFNDPGYTFVQDTIPDFEKPFPAPQPNPNEFIPKQPCMNLPITIKITAEKPSKSSPTQYVMVTLLRHSKRLDVAAGQHQHFFYGLVVEDECSEGGSLMGYKTWGLLDFFARLCGKKRGYVEYQIRSCEDVKVKVRCMPFTNPNCYLWWNPPATRLEQSTDSNQFLPFAVQTPIIDGERAKYIARCVGNLSSLDPEIQFTNLFMRKRTNEEVNQPEPSAPGQANPITTYVDHECRARLEELEQTVANLINNAGYLQGGRRSKGQRKYRKIQEQTTPPTDITTDTSQISYEECSRMASELAQIV